MPKRLPHDDGYDYEDDDSDVRYRVRKLRREKEDDDKKKHWDRENIYNRDNDYDERR